MKISMVSAFLSIIIANIFNLLASTISMKTKEDQEKSSPFECGFDPLKSPRLPFSIRFFLITIIFLIFDVEITIILPMIETFNKSNLLTWLIIFISFMLVLIIGLIHEWNQGALQWIN